MLGAARPSGDGVAHADAIELNDAVGTFYTLQGFPTCRYCENKFVLTQSFREVFFTYLDSHLDSHGGRQPMQPVDNGGKRRLI
jgi:hypothetical protein